MPPADGHHLQPDTTRKPLDIGLLDLSQATWRAGRALTSVMLGALARRIDPSRERITLFSADDWGSLPAGVRRLPLEAPSTRPLDRVRRLALRNRDQLPVSEAEWRVRTRLGIVDPSDPIHRAKSAGMDVVLPITAPSALGVSIGRVAWIPDFQHVLMPQFFAEPEIVGRTDAYRALTRACDAILLSSEAVRSDFERLFPEHMHKVTVASFVSRYALSAPTASAEGIPSQIRSLGLPPKFALVVNQFWGHKNHETVVDAVARCRALGFDIPVVMVGALNDYRDPKAATLSRIFQRMTRERVNDRVMILGEVDGPTIDALLRAAAVVIQPSLCEGWNTTVEDLKALGRPAVCSDLAVHREQMPDALGFFPPTDGAALAALLADRWAGLTPGPDAAREAVALEAAQRRLDEYGDVLVRVVRGAGRGKGGG